MNAITLLYHDVVAGSDYASSGFAGADADIYKLNRDQFTRHLDAIAAAVQQPPTLFSGLSENDSHPPRVLLSFDDGGVSAHPTADMLEQRGWRGHFFIPTDFIGCPGFLTVSQLRDLHRRGHAIGSHSASHPSRISHLPKERIEQEWVQSSSVLAGILGSPINTASVPAGFYSAGVASAAARAGICILFNSEPVTRIYRAGDVSVVGRFSLQRADMETIAAALAGGASLPRFRQWAFWNSKKILKSVGGKTWLDFRKRFLAGRE